MVHKHEWKKGYRNLSGGKQMLFHLCRCGKLVPYDVVGLEHKDYVHANQAKEENSKPVKERS